MTSADFYEADRSPDRGPLPVTGFHRHAWLSFYREWRELDCGDLGSRVERDLELV